MYLLGYLGQCCNGLNCIALYQPLGVSDVWKLLCRPSLWFQLFRQHMECFWLDVWLRRCFRNWSIQKEIRRGTEWMRQQNKGAPAGGMGSCVYDPVCWVSIQLPKNIAQTHSVIIFPTQDTEMWLLSSQGNLGWTLYLLHIACSCLQMGCCLYMKEA